MTLAETAGAAPDAPAVAPAHQGQGPEPISPAAFFGIAVTSFGGPLVLAALAAPSIVAEVTRSGGFAVLVAAGIFACPLVIWLRYNRRVASPAGLTGYVQAAAGPDVARVQAGLWIVSYLLYLAFTTADVVYELLPAVVPGVRPYRGVLEIALPVALAATMLAGRRVTLAVVGLIAVAQVALTGLLDVVAVGHDAPLGSLAPHGAAGDTSRAAAQVSLLYVCGSLPVFFGGELARPAVTIRRGLLGAYALTTVLIVAAVVPLAANPAFTRAEVPGMSVVRIFAGHGAAVAVGLGVALSTVGVMLVEFFALSRLVPAVSRLSVPRAIRALSVVLVGSALISLVNPERFYEDLLKPSLIALWLSQLIVFLVYPRFARRNGGLRASDVLLTVVSCAFTVYGIYATLHHAVS